MPPPDSEPPAARRPADTPFKQQRLRAWQPVFSPPWVIACFVVTACVFIPIGALITVASDGIVEEEVRYDDAAGVKDCHWDRGANAFSPSCLTAGYGTAAECGMLANLPAACPRDFSPSGMSSHSLDQLSTLGQATNGDRTCDPKCTGTVTFTVTETLEAPVYMYYKLTNFYQNHRRYAQSRADLQLSGSSVSNGDAFTCPPLRNLGTVGDDGWCSQHFGDKCDHLSVGHCQSLNRSGAAEQCSDYRHSAYTEDFMYSSCGLIAWSMFNDSFTLEKCSDDSCSAVDTTICRGDMFDRRTSESKWAGNRCEKKEIAWSADRERKFEEPKTGPRTLTYKGFKEDLMRCRSGHSSDPNCTFWTRDRAVLPYFMNGWYLFDPYHDIPAPVDEDFMVWMRIASLPTFRKLYRRINVDLTPGTYRLVIDHRFDLSDFDGEKAVVLTTLSWIGGRNFFLGYTYLAVGVLCAVLAVLFAVKSIYFPTDTAAIMERKLQPE